MRVCLLTRYFDLRNAGIGRFSLEMLKGLKEREIQVTRVSTNRSGSVGYFVYSALEIPFKLPKGQDVYHALTPMESIYLPKERSIVTFHDLIPWLYLDRIETHYTAGRLKTVRQIISKHYFTLACKLAGRCKIIVCDSEQTKEDVLLHLNIKDETRIRVIRLGISPQLKPAERKDRVFRIGTLSYLDKRKRIDLLVTSFLQANIDAELVIGGTGTDEARLKTLSKGDKRIRFLGFIPDDRLAEFYNSLDVFVFPTAVEGYGLPIVEAMACQKPVVVLKDAIIPKEVKSRCIVVESLEEFFNKPIDSMDRFGTVVEHLGIHNSIEDNYRFAKLHSWETCIGEYIKLYQEVLE